MLWLFRTVFTTLSCFFVIKKLNFCSVYENMTIYLLILCDTRVFIVTIIFTDVVEVEPVPSFAISDCSELWF